VLFRGVRIGYVTEIQVTTDETMLRYQIPVTFEILPDAVTVVANGQPLGNLATASRLDEMIRAGLRTQLDVESFVTGQLVIDLDMHPDTQPVFRGRNPPHPEIPSVPSGIQQVMQRIERILTDVQEKVPVDEVIADLLTAINGFSTIVNSPELKQAIAGVNSLVNDPATRRLPGAAQGAVAELRAAAADARNLIGHTDRNLEPVLGRAADALESFGTTLEQGEAVLRLARVQLESNPEAAAQLAEALRELERSSRAIRVLVDTLERQPEALLRGKSRP